MALRIISSRARVVLRSDSRSTVVVVLVRKQFASGMARLVGRTTAKVVTGDGRGRGRGFGQLRPDRLPVVGAKVFAGYLAIGGKLDRGAALQRDRAGARCPLAQHWGWDAHLIGKP